MKIIYPAPGDLEGLRWLRYLDGECFPDDKPLQLDATIRWNLIATERDPVAFCGWQPIRPKLGFHFRAGVLPAARGRGLQKFMIGLREDAMRREGIDTAITYTEAYGNASMNSLISCGYRPFAPDIEIVRWIVISADRWKQMVYWKKLL